MFLQQLKLEQLKFLHSEIPPAAPWLTILVIHSRSHMKKRQSQSYKLQKIAKNLNFTILHRISHATHLLKLLDKMYKYEMDPTIIVGATEPKPDAGRTDGQMDGRMEWNQYTPQQLCITRQIWGIWKLRPAYSPETPNLGQKRWCFVPCDLEIWWMTLKNNRAPLLCCFKLCATFHNHQWIQTGVAVQKRSISVKYDDF